MPSLVGDSGQVLGVLGWALTRIFNLPLEQLTNMSLADIESGSEQNLAYIDLKHIGV